MGEPILEIDNIKVRYSGLPVLQGISLTVKDGETVSVLGANGAGKSTLLRSGMGTQPKNHANFPADFNEKFFRELTKEYKREVKNAEGTIKSFEWYRPGNADNHSWDITIYNVAAREIIAADTCEKVIGLVDGVDWPVFNRFVAERDYFRTNAPALDKGTSQG